MFVDIVGQERKTCILHQQLKANKGWMGEHGREDESGRHSGDVQEGEGGGGERC